MFDPSTRSKTTLVLVLILLPLLLTAVMKYLPAFTKQPRISAVSILIPRVRGPEQYSYMEGDVMERLRDELGKIDGVRLADSPSSQPKDGDDLAAIARGVGADALIATTLTIDEGLVQLNAQIIDPLTKRILFSTPYQSSLDRFPEMMKAAGAGLRRALQP